MNPPDNQPADGCAKKREFVSPSLAETLKALSAKITALERDIEKLKRRRTFPQNLK